MMGTECDGVMVGLMAAVIECCEIPTLDSAAAPPKHKLSHYAALSLH